MKAPSHDEPKHEPDRQTGLATTVGGHLASRIVQAGTRAFFTVPGDFNLVLLDQLIKQPGLRMIGCCNELNAGYAADGYARATGGLSVVVVTYMVGGLSVINAVAGAYSDDLPVLVVSGGPNTLDAAANHRVHHTIGEAELYQCAECFEPVVAANLRCATSRRRRRDDRPCGHVMSGEAQAGVSGNRLQSGRRSATRADADQPAAARALQPTRPRSRRLPQALAARIDVAAKPVLVAGVKLRSQGATAAFRQLADALGCAVAVMPDAKGLFPESHPAFIGTYWGSVSSPNCAEIVESSDCQLFAGPMFNDYTTTGWTTLTTPSKLVHAGPDFLRMEGAEFTGLRLDALLGLLASKVAKKPATLESYRRRHEPAAPAAAAPASEPLSLTELRRQIQALLAANNDLVVETGDSWFNGQKLHLPDGAGYHFQMQYGSIGWATGATLGVALGAGADRRTVALIGDGSFQLTAQEVSTMIRHQAKPIIFLLNNRGYTIEVEIHDGPYNNIKNWDYAGLVDVFNAGEAGGLGLRARPPANWPPPLSRPNRMPVWC